MKYQIGEKIGEIARVYHSFREHDTLAKRIEGRFVSNPFEVDVLIDEILRQALENSQNKTTEQSITPSTIS